MISRRYAESRATVLQKPPTPKQVEALRLIDAERSAGRTLTIEALREW